ncbi:MULTISPECIES: hypothetical protein [unclassified Caballeronia]|uniref:hypothetical protein n=1 Tax=unclassified Caballeronia TaxID=2646786 RepID=UPI002028CD6C|nr:MULTISPECIES: hypothetical protein [unclassified Caballeronia]
MPELPDRARFPHARFFCRALHKPFVGRLAGYEMRYIAGKSNILRDPSIVSGCLIRFRTDVLKSFGCFHARYFPASGIATTYLAARVQMVRSIPPRRRNAHRGSKRCCNRTPDQFDGMLAVDVAARRASVTRVVPMSSITVLGPTAIGRRRSFLEMQASRIKDQMRNCRRGSAT